MEKLIQLEINLKDKDDQILSAQTQLLETLTKLQEKQREITDYATRKELKHSTIENSENLQKIINIQTQMIHKETQTADIQQKLLEKLHKSQTENKETLQKQKYWKSQEV